MAEGEGNGVEAGGGGGGAGAGEKKVMKFSFAKAKQRPPLPSKGKEKEKEKKDVVEYVTSVDATAGIVVLNPRAGGGKKVVPKLENTWRPEKRMKNIMMESDATKPTEKTFEMETMGAGPKPNVQYGLTVMERAGGEGQRRISLKELEDQKLREDLANLPEEATLDQYEELPVEEFGEALLRGMGWEKGKPIGRNSKTVVEPVEYTRRQGMLGLGATPPPPKPTDKKYIKPGETREKKRDDMSRSDEHRGSRRDDSRRDEHRESRRDDSRRDEYRDSRRNEHRDSGRNEHRNSRRDEHRESRRDDRRDEYRESRREHKSRNYD